MTDKESNDYIDDENANDNDVDDDVYVGEQIFLRFKTSRSSNFLNENYMKTFSTARHELFS